MKGRGSGSDTSSNLGQVRFPPPESGNSTERGAQGRAKRTPDPDAGIAAAYDSRAAGYLEIAGDIEQMDARDRALIEGWRDAASGRLLDAGCGPGHWSDLLSRRGREVVGVDLSERFIASARVRYPEPSFHVASFRDLPLDDAAVGGILAWYSLIHTPPADIPAVLDEFARVLIPGGGLLLGFFDGPPRESFAHAVAPAWFWSPEALGGLLADAGFTVGGIHRRSREPGEISVRPHADMAATRSRGVLIS